MSDSSADDSDIPDEIMNLANKAINETLPSKSKTIYQGCFDEFLEWQKSKKTKSCKEEVFLAYFHELSEKYKSSTLWSKYSMLKSMLKVNRNIDISAYTRVTAYLKRQHTGYSAKKSKVFSNEECKRFVDDAPNAEFLPHKAALILGLHGACRREELWNLTMDEIKTTDSIMIVKIPKTKNGVPRTFTLEGYYYDLVSMYVLQRPSNLTTNKFFVRYKNGKIENQPIGINTIGKMPSLIATWLNLSEPSKYTGHSFRRTSATLLADTGANTLELQRHGGWKSARVAEGYVEDSVGNKRKISKKISNAIDDTEAGPSKKAKTTTKVVVTKTTITRND